MEDLSRHRWIATNVLPYESELRGYLKKRLRAFNSNDADDVIQEAYARIWTADLSTIRDGRSYLYATVRHLLAEYARRRRIVPIELLGEIDSLSIISDEPGPERLVGARQELNRLRAIVARLPVQCRQVFELRRFEGLSHREVAQRMGLRIKTVENHLTRALARVAEALTASDASSDTYSMESSARRAAENDRGID